MNTNSADKLLLVRIILPSATLNCSRFGVISVKGSVTTRWLGGGGRRPFEVHSFHASRIGIMLKKIKYWGDTSPRPPDGGGPDLCNIDSHQNLPKSLGTIVASL